MCGIVGGIGARPFDFLEQPERVERAIDLLAHRGPDDRGRCEWPDRRGFLGHRRLSIIDLAGGRQPIANEAGDVHICYNGEIYNFRALREDLWRRGHRLATRTDGEVALHLYEEDPRTFVDHLAGMFAIAILDRRAGRLTLVRDRNGIKPLYYLHDGSKLLFASELKGILALLDSPPALSAAALRAYLRWKYVPAPLTIWRHVRKLPAGHMLTAQISGDGIAAETRPWWDVDFGFPKVADEGEALERLDQTLRAAVTSHLESDVEVGTLLSGGVDSSLVTALAAIISGRRIKTFSVGFEESGFDQLPFARTLAQRYRTEHFEELVRLDPIETIARLVRHFDEPFADSSALACYRVCEVAARHVKVVLTGDGGDESFAGYRRYEEILPAARRRRSWRRLLAPMIVATSSPLFSPEAKYLKHIRAAMKSPLDRHEEHQVLFSPWLARRILAEPCRAGPDGAGDNPGESDDCFASLRRRAAGRGWSPVEIAQYVDLRMYLPEDILTKVDRTSMACSLECRVPLLDHSVTQFSASLATDLKLRPPVRKYLLKKLAERYVPHELLYRPKMGFRVPIRRWFKGPLLDEAGRALLGGRLVAGGILDRAGLHWMLHRQRRPWIDFGSHFWALLFLEYWARAYLP